MNKEPIALYIFRFILGFGLFAFMTMLYWSSQLIEKDMKSLQTDLTQIKTAINTLKGEIQQAPPSVSSTPPSLPSSSSSVVASNNLLTPDPFYQTEIQKLLGPDFKPQGIRREAALGKPDNLHPFSNWAHIAAWNGLCTIGLIGQDIGKYETFTPEMALSMELKNEVEYWLTLRQDVFWQPLDPQHFSSTVTLASHFLKPHQVTAHDFKFYFDAVMNPNVDMEQAVAMRTYYQEIEEVRVVDDFTLVVRWKTEEVKDTQGNSVRLMKYMAKSITGSLRPLPCFVYQYFADGLKIIENAEATSYRTSAIWAQNFAQHWAKNIIVSCGGWLFDGMTDQEIHFRRNPNYFNPLTVLVEGLEIKFKDSPDIIWEQFKSGALDLFIIAPNQLAELDRFLESAPYQQQAAQGLGIKKITYTDRSYVYLGWNEARPLFNNPRIRQALTHAIDRERVIRQNLNGMGIQTTGTFSIFSPSYDKSIEPYPFDPQEARRLLQEEGWVDSDGDGIIDKMINGKRVPFAFSLTYYVKNPTIKSICEYIATALKDIGIVCNLNGVDMADLSTVFSDKNFDAVYLGWSLGAPPEDPKQLWYSSGAKEAGSSNAIGFANPEVDKIIDQLAYTYDSEKRNALYHRFDAIIHEEAPYTFMYIPKVTLVYRDYLQNVFIPAERQDLIPGANVEDPQSNLYWIRPHTGD
jgi:peptide/nickel transport system substrate-binding protein